MVKKYRNKIMSYVSIILFLMISLFTRNAFSFKALRRKTVNVQVTNLSSATSNGIQRNVLVPVAHGSEEIESVTIIDTLVRAGATVVVASVSDTLQVLCSRGVKITADTFIKDCVGKNWDLIVLPGGMPGAEHLRDSSDLSTLIKKQHSENKLLGAICAAPAVALAPLGWYLSHKPKQMYLILILTQF